MSLSLKLFSNIDLILVVHSLHTCTPVADAELDAFEDDAAAPAAAVPPLVNNDLGVFALCGLPSAPLGGFIFLGCCCGVLLPFGWPICDCERAPLLSVARPDAPLLSAAPAAAAATFVGNVVGRECGIAAAVAAAPVDDADNTACVADGPAAVAEGTAVSLPKLESDDEIADRSEPKPAAIFDESSSFLSEEVCVFL